MSDQSPARASHPADLNGALRLLALIAVVIGVLVLAAAAFVLSYTGIHAIALSAGVSAELARLYPLIFDAMLVVAAAAILSLRGAGLLMRCYAWLSMLVLLCAAAGADALHATATRLPHRTAAATVAIIPWALALLGFGLLLAMLRHARLRRGQAAETTADAGSAAPAAAPAARAAAPAAATALAIPPAAIPASGTQAAQVAAARVQGTGTLEAGALAGQRAGADQAVAVGEGRDPAATTGQETSATRESDGRAAESPPSAPSWPSVPSTSVSPARGGKHADGQATELALDAEPGNDDPTSDEARSENLGPAHWVPRARAEEQRAADHSYTGDYPAPVMSPAPVFSPAPVVEVITEQAGKREQARHAAPEPASQESDEPAAGRRADPDEPSAGHQAAADGQVTAELPAPEGSVSADSTADAEGQAAAAQPAEAGTEAAADGMSSADREARAERPGDAEQLADADGADAGGAGAASAGADNQAAAGPQAPAESQPARSEPAAEHGSEPDDEPAADDEAEQDPITIAPFDRMWSSPVPPDA